MNENGALDMIRSAAEEVKELEAENARLKEGVQELERMIHEAHGDLVVRLLNEASRKTLEAEAAEKRMQELEAQLKDLDDGMTIVYMRGVEDGKDAFRVRLAQAEGLLKELEWVPDSDGPHSQYCPSCGGVLRRHETYCRLSAFLHPEQEKKV